MFDKLTGPESPGTLRMREQLAEAYLGAGQDKEAITLLETYIRVSERTFGALPSGDPLAAYAQIGMCPARVKLGRAYERAGQKDKAQAQFAAAERVLRAAATWATGTPQDDVMKLAARAGLGEVLVAQKKYREAEPHLLATHQEMTRRPEVDGDDGRQVIEWLIEVYEATGQPEKKADWQAKLKALPATPKAGAAR
jgi:hypothetical protein